MRLALVVVLASTVVFGQQQGPCQSRCNVQAGECMKSCMGDPKEANKPERAQHLQECLRQCDAQNAQCKQECPKK